jgi:hypothetical protein
VAINRPADLHAIEGRDVTGYGIVPGGTSALRRACDSNSSALLGSPLNQSCSSPRVGEGEGIDATPTAAGDLHVLSADVKIVPMRVIDLHVTTRPTAP